ncbi:MAG: multiheme c-type cytochrome, partial [Kofleriaceae bacterium]
IVAGVPDDAPIDAATNDASARPSGKVFATGASRCGECHGKMYDEWEGSAHARAKTSLTYQAAFADAKDATCDRCHAPLGALTGQDIISTEGVTCDVCHTLREPRPSAGGGSFRLAIDDMVKYGPRCGLKNHYFHRMGCSPEHAEAVICGSCHWWERKGVPVLTEYADWRAGPAARTPCQGCHMPTERASLAVGSPVRAGVPHHGLLGAAGELRQRALALAVAAHDDGADGTAVAVTLSNVSAGHHVPAGLPERRVVVRVTVGGEVQTRALGRVLVNAAGIEVPFWRATKVSRDSRIAPGASWHETFKFRARGPAVVEVIYRAMSDVLARELGLVDVPDEPMVTLRVAPGATATRKPGPAGERTRP